MNDFFNSQFVTDLKNGELPEVKVGIETTSILMLAGALLLVGAILVVGKSMIK
ncbi:MAG: hypothetical protein LBM68_05495 [Bacteroidales bacterium]|jgi:hypothetical protein|nr:hypothetical protein [Bacteroidales bacterium]